MGGIEAATELFRSYFGDGETPEAVANAYIISIIPIAC